MRSRITHIARRICASLFFCGLLIALPGPASVAQDIPVPNASKGYTKGGKVVSDAIGKGKIGQSSSAGAGGRVASGPVNSGRSVANPTGRDKWGRIDKRYTGQRCETIENGVRVQRGC